MSIECYEKDCKYHPAKLYPNYDWGPFCEREACIHTTITYDIDTLLYYGLRARDALVTFCDEVMRQKGDNE